MGLAPTPTNLTQPFGGAVSDLPAIATAATLPSSEASTVLSSDFETFLKMLTAQAEYQDPLEPIDSSEYAAQLAQFSMVEQQVLANERLEEMTAQLAIANMSQLATMIGMEARTIEPVLFSGDTIRVAVDPVTDADQAFLVVKNDQGLEVDRREITLEARDLTWNGRDPSGGTFPEGLYSFEVQNFAQGKEIATDKAAVYLRIEEARSIEGEAGLILAGGTELLARNLEGLREG